MVFNQRSYENPARFGFNGPQRPYSLQKGLSVILTESDDLIPKNAGESMRISMK
ncbi:Uncharacterised protein [Chlamydia abortus]|nr:Uncharacterised protein [Chlamydia abortus]